ncbi:hypothetical protein QA645_39980 [Bradyrhizobium sp. CIAT3101]|uniref:hypothetical protein n=1 Tax=Bradyrhizobium sp. CIAT3101 TaxID=439387 RepID=UPI0024B1CD0A|nr:hypothetical protein [Bradyrhizobium sp. CIAT3101]WFU80564.1 hypothetical protein QA645_39980 [Bradyrhizobium sp. CIAT3101]
MDVELARRGGLDLVEELAKLGGEVAFLALADDLSGRNVEGCRRPQGEDHFVHRETQRKRLSMTLLWG